MAASAWGKPWWPLEGRGFSVWCHDILYCGCQDILYNGVQ